MKAGRSGPFALVALGLTVGLLILAPVLAMAGAPVELVGIVSLLILVAIPVALLAVIRMASRGAVWPLALAGIALAAELAAAVLLQAWRVPVRPDSWFWPLVNTLYFGGLAFALAGLISSVIVFATSRAIPAGMAFVLAAGAVVVNRLAPYR